MVIWEMRVQSYFQAVPEARFQTNWNRSKRWRWSGDLPGLGLTVQRGAVRHQSPAV